MSSVIAVKKFAKSNPKLGFIQPIILERDGLPLPIKAQPEQFPKNGTIFVTAGYDNIDQDFAENELFRISYRLSEYETGYNDDDYVCYAEDVQNSKRLEKYEYFHIVETEFDLSKRNIELQFEPTRWLMLHSVARGLLIGPFDYTDIIINRTTVEVRLNACATLKGFHSHDSNSVYQFQADLFDTATHAGQVTLLADIKDLANNISRETIDFISDENLLKLGNELLPENGRVPKNDLKTYRNTLATLTSSPSNLDITRRARLMALIDRLDFWTLQRSALVSEFLKSEEGQKQLKAYLEDDKQHYINLAHEQYSDELKTKKKELDDQITLLKEERDQLEQANQKTKAVLATERREQTSQELQDKQNEVKEKEKELEVLLDKLRVAGNIHELKVEYGVLEREEKKKKDDIKNLQEQASSLEAAYKETMEQVGIGQNRLRERMHELKPLVDMLNGVISTPTALSRPTIVPPKQREDVPANAQELIAEVQKSLERNGRAFNLEEVANFLVSIHQSFLTVFAGLPGVGKTSLATYLTRALGMQNRLLYIPVSRGMTSQRDLLGFYNPLTQRYQPAPTKLYDTLVQEDADGGRFPAWVLLDEANLSPIEHYFSSFLPMCDSDNLSKEIKTGDLNSSEIITVPASLRFLATINYDNTTEALSARLIDRVPVITIEPPDEDDSSNVIAPTLPESLLTYEDLDRLLTPLGTVELTDDEERVLGRIISALKSVHDSHQGLPVIVSPRKRNSIRKYCFAAQRLMQDGPALRALDYAIAQHVLPLLSGNGEQYLNRLSVLQDAVQSLDFTKRRLKHIVEVGNNDHKFYRFFC